MFKLLADEVNTAELLATPKFRRGLALLLESTIYAKRTSADLWEFAVNIHELHRAGLSDNDVRFLLRLEYLAQGLDVSTSTSGNREDRIAEVQSFSKRTLFVLTEHGVDAGAKALGDVPVSCSNCRLRAPASRFAPAATDAPLPVWNAERRVLAVGGRIVKHFKRRAMNQELILASFQEEGWPNRILDPLSPHPAQDVKRRLSDTIKHLNRRQQIRLIRFHGDGSGQGVVWEAAVENPLVNETCPISTGAL
jgi:hypothetical protein